ncbi:hypothetical protein MTR_3g074100 [Medicago truncatula]|uniref:Uncharacterized protein n=1 Tax=Medicago truncatula TaxID=3880 RepID=A0A072V9R9_MEDTR|nr:hypothetical protein MTR_3g074100 [Medicago truncatula]
MTIDEAHDNGWKGSDGSESLRVSHILVDVDIIISLLKNRFEQLEVFESIANFLFDARTLKSLDDDEFKKSCTNFDATSSHKDLSVVDANDFFCLYLKYYKYLCQMC